jgi:ribosome biogenesis protein UTP30
MARRKEKAAQHAGKQPLLLPAKLAPRTVAAPPPLAAHAVDQDQCRKAIDALVANVKRQHAKREATELIETDDRLDLVITLKRMAPREKTMPIRLYVATPSLAFRHTLTRIIDLSRTRPSTRAPSQSASSPRTRNDSTRTSSQTGRSPLSQRSSVLPSSRERSEPAPALPVHCSLPAQFKPFEARRQLLRDHDLFLADDNIIPMLPKLLGKQWIEAKKCVHA